VYEIRLVQARRALQVAEPIVSDAQLAARTMYQLLGLTDREHVAALFLNGRHHITGAHVVAIGGQHGVGTLEPRTVFRAAIQACASAVILGHYVPRNIMPLLFPPRLCSRITAEQHSRRSESSRIAT
jgi:DNA repair protein RadC